MKKSQKHPTQYLIVDEFERINRDRPRPHSPLPLFAHTKNEEVQCRRCQQHVPAPSLSAHQSSCGQHLQWQDRQMEDHYDLRGHRLQEGYKRSMIHSRQEPIRNENVDYYPRVQSKVKQQEATNKTKRPMSAIGKKKAENKPQQPIQRIKKTISTSKLREERPKMNSTAHRERGECELQNNFTLRRQAEPIRLKKKNANLAQKSLKISQQSRAANKMNAEEYCQLYGHNREQEKQQVTRPQIKHSLKQSRISREQEKNERVRNERQSQERQREEARQANIQRIRKAAQQAKILNDQRIKQRDQPSRTETRTQREQTRQPTRVSRPQPRPQEQRRPQRVQRQERHERQERPQRQQERPERQERRQERRGNNRGRGMRGRASRVDSPSNIFNFVSQAMNEQLSLMNSQFSIMSNVFENFSNFIHINIDTRPVYFPGSSEHFESSDQYSDSSESDDSDYDYEVSEPEGMDEDQIEMIPSQKYHSAKHGHHQCTVCLAELQEGDVVKKLYCQHIFHADCISEWLKRKSACPVCRDHIGPH